MARRLNETPRRGTAVGAVSSHRPAGRPSEHGRPNQPGPRKPAPPDREAADSPLPALRRHVADLEASLWLVEERLQQITDTSLDVICHFRPDGVFTFVSRASLQVLGYSPEEIVGTHFRDYFAPADVASAAAIFERAVGGEQIELIEVTARHRDGHAVPLEVGAVSLVRGGRMIGVQGIARDVSKRKGTAEGLRLYSERLEGLIQAHDSEMASARAAFALRLGRSHALGRALREREELLRAAFEQAGIGLAVLGLDGRFLRVNTVLAELLGAGRDELLDLRWQDLTLPDDLAGETALWTRLCEGEIASSTGERTWVRRDGKRAVTRVTVSVIRTTDGPPSHLMIAILAIA